MTLKQIPNSLSAPDGSQYVTLTDGAGNLVTAGGGTPAAPTNSVQFNNAGAFGGDSQILINGTNHILDFGGITSSFAGLKQSASAVNTNRVSVRLGDDSDWGNLAVSNVDLMLTGSTRAGIVAASGSSLFLASTSATAPTVVDATAFGGRGDVRISGALCDSTYSFQTPATAFSITIGNAIWHLVLDPAGTLATGTITMPAAPQDGQIVNIRCSQTITTLTVSPNTGQSVKNAPTTIAPGGIVEAIFRTANTTWYF